MELKFITSQIYEKIQKILYPTFKNEFAPSPLVEYVLCVRYGYIGARNGTTQQSGQTPDKEVEIKNITVYVSGCTETDTTGMLSPLTVWH